MLLQIRRVTTVTRRNKFKNDIEYEICINCGGVTDIPKNMDVSCRKHYVLGMGQLCADCYEQLELMNSPRYK